MSLYQSRRDSRLFVPKRIAGLGWTINLGHPSATGALVLIGVALCLLPALIAGTWHWSTLMSAPGPWLWLAASLVLAVAAAFLNGLCRYRLSHVPLATTCGVFAALVGFTIQRILNGPVVAILGDTSLTWRVHLYLALAAAVSQTIGKCLFVPLGWKLLQVDDGADKIRVGLLAGLGFTVFEILVIWSQVLWAGETLTGWQLGALERGIASVFHIYSTGLLAIGLVDRRLFPFVLVIAVHYLTDWAVGANASLLHFSPVQLEVAFLIPVVVLWLTFLILARQSHAKT